MPLAISTFKSDEKREMNGLINDLRIKMKFEKGIKDVF